MTVRLITYSQLSYLCVDEIPNSDETVIFELPADMALKAVLAPPVSKELQHYAVDVIQQHLTQMKRNLTR
jgi:hypothetical protein